MFKWWGWSFTELRTMSVEHGEINIHIPSTWIKLAKIKILRIECLANNIAVWLRYRN